MSLSDADIIDISAYLSASAYVLLSEQLLLTAPELRTNRIISHNVRNNYGIDILTHISNRRYSSYHSEIYAWYNSDERYELDCLIRDGFRGNVYAHLIQAIKLNYPIVVSYIIRQPNVCPIMSNVHPLTVAVKENSVHAFNVMMDSRLMLEQHQQYLWCEIATNNNNASFVMSIIRMFNNAHVFTLVRHTLLHAVKERKLDIIDKIIGIMRNTNFDIGPIFISSLISSNKNPRIPQMIAKKYGDMLQQFYINQGIQISTNKRHTTLTKTLTELRRS